MLRLNDFMALGDQQQGLGVLRCLKNSIKRNLILPSLTMIRSQAISQYQTKLTRHNFQQKDLSLLFQHLYSKDQMTVSDRNLIRRILLSMFPQSLIVAGGKRLLSFAAFQNYDQGTKFQGQNYFYLILQGIVKVQSGFYHKRLKSGQYFGHMELLLEYSGQSYRVKAETDVLMLKISQQGFKQSISKYFTTLFEDKKKLIPKSVKQKIQQIQVLLLCEDMERKAFSIGERISKIGDEIQQVTFIEQGKINENYNSEPEVKKYRSANVVGLIETIKSQKCYMFDVFALEECKAYVINVHKFKRTCHKFLNLGVMKGSNKSILEVQRSRTEGSMEKTKKTEQESKQKQLKQLDVVRQFTKIRKVNLPYYQQKTPLSEKSIPSTIQQSYRTKKIQRKKYQAEFIFIKQGKLENNIKKDIINRSCSLIQHNQQQNSQVKKTLQSSYISEAKRYVNNIDLPSLANLKKDIKQSL